MRAEYRWAVFYGGLFVIWGTAGYLQYHYHQHITSGMYAVCVMSLVGLVLSIRRGRRGK